ncbi:MAG: PIN domain-containing protein, partial [Candidatus Lokiarchaeota archaeon]|nr:PIN domain-containing protein [Candidatus Lokiarchaeota archaeon]
HKVEIYIVDAVAFLAYLADKLPKKADDIFRKAEKKEIKLLLPSIALGETLYTIYKGKQIFGEEIPLEKIDLIFQVLKNGEIFELADLNLDAWFIFHGLNIPELHDRMIAATFYYYKASGLITNDPEISESLPMIWK